MKPTNTDNVSCLILGHNFYKEQTFYKNSDKLCCKNCNHTILTDKHGNFNSSGSADKTFENTLRKLFLLRKTIAANS